MADESERVDTTTIVDLVERACHQHAEVLAVTGVGGPLTYGELWRRSGSVASDLQSRGVRLEDRVGVWAAQSSELLVGILGILRAGAAYVPLEPTLPETRLEYIVRDAGVNLIVAPDELLDAAASIVPNVLGTTGSVAALGSLPIVRPENAAYVIYTSGSSGRPKGVIVEHGSVVGLLGWIGQERTVEPGDRFLGTASPAFDASIPILFFPLVSGGTFVAIEPAVARDPIELAEQIQRSSPRVLLTAPTMLRMLMETSWPGDPTLEIWTGGERTAPDVIQYLAPRVQSLCNWYGPTEATVQVAMARLGPNDLEAPVRSSPAYTSCVLLDGSRHPTVPGEVGEIYITGGSLARGYLNDPELTKDRFVSIELNGSGPVRAYRTGDLGRWEADGALVILGRLDEQLNVRGYRVEPREVEECLLGHDGVLEAVVVASDAQDGTDGDLVAYVKARPGVSGAAIRERARDLLPFHMVPLVVLVDAYPVTSAGKIDRRRLAEAATEERPGGHLPDSSAELVTATELERTIIAIFASVLSIDPSRIGLDDDFFDLGGTSLRNLRLFMQIDERLGVRLSLSTLTTAATPRLVAAAVATEQRRSGVKPLRGEPPRHEWERILSSIWLDLLGIANVARTDSFFDLGGTPASASRMLEQLHVLYGVSVSFQEFEESPTIEDLAALVGGRTVRSNLVPLTTSGTRRPFFLIAGAGGLAVTFLPLARLLGQDQPVYGLQAQGIESRGIPDLTFKQHTARYVRAIREVQPHGPYFLGGHSLGGIHALNAAHRLCDEGEEVALLAIFDAYLTRRMIGREAGSDPVPPGFREHTMPRGLPKLSTVLHLPVVGLVPLRGTAQFEAFAALGEIQALLCGRLRPWSGRSVVFLSDDEESALVESRWSHLLTGPWRSARVPGGHIAMLEQANIEFAAVALREELDDVLGHVASPVAAAGARDAVVEEEPPLAS
jgi:amino acid adenylation domain-containing protein